MNVNKIKFIYFKQERAISTLRGRPLKIDKFTYLSSDISTTESDVNISLLKAWTAIKILAIISKSDLSDRIKWCSSVNDTVWTHYMDAIRMHRKKGI